jgi:hypothetical protein
VPVTTPFVQGRGERSKSKAFLFEYKFTLEFVELLEFERQRTEVWAELPFIYDKECYEARG